MSDRAEAKARKIKGIGRPVGSSRETSLARILPAARRLFAEKGYAKTTFKDVGAAVGMTHAALYGYFPSKAELFQAACEHAQELMRDEYATAIREETTLRGQLRQILRAGARAHDRDPSITALLGSIPLEVRRHPELNELLYDQQNATMMMLRAAFEHAQQRGEISAGVDPDQLVVAILGAALGIGLLEFGLQRTSLTESMEVFIDLLEARFFIGGESNQEG